MKTRIFFALVCLIAPPLQIAAAMSVSDYGQLPSIRSVAISPNGQYLAFIRRTDEGDVFAINDLNSGEFVGGARAGSFKARGLSFVTNEHVMFSTSQTRRSTRVRGSWENNGAVVYSIKKKKMQTMLHGIDDLYLAQSGLGRSVGIVRDESVAIMPAYAGANAAPRYALFKVSLDNGRARQIERGNSETIDWFVDDQGEVLAREEFNGKHRKYRIYSRITGKWEKIYEKDTDRPNLGLVGLTNDGQSLIYNAYDNDNTAIFHMALTDGETSGPFYEVPERDVDEVLLDANRKFKGVLYSGLLPQFDYVNSDMNDAVVAVQDQFPHSAVEPVSATDDLSKIVFRVSGPRAAQNYLLFNSGENSLAKIGSAYPNVSTEQIGDVRAIRYKARDGLPIYAVVTWPVGVEKEARKGLPMLVFPHGGPESYDTIEFDWWAQYFARRGYVVLQPNFRGSTGSGAEFRNAGRGKWGKEMQHDVSDGVAAMIDAGHVDPQRVCIMGASYGGYAALAGGAFTPELYRCVVAVAGVSDLPRMLRDTQDRRGRHHWVVSYWNDVIGDAKSEQDKLKSISPINYASEFQAPVLLLHGKDDTVVPLRQSKIMEKALKRADKPVEMVTLRGEDHWLSTSETRLEMLEKIDEFVSKHNPPGVVAP